MTGEEERGEKRGFETSDAQKEWYVFSDEMALEKGCTFQLLSASSRHQI